MKYVPVRGAKKALRQVQRQRLGQTQRQGPRAKEVVWNVPEAFAKRIFVVFKGESEFLEEFEIALNRSLTDIEFPGQLSQTQAATASLEGA